MPLWRGPFPAQACTWRLRAQSFSPHAACTTTWRLWAQSLFSHCPCLHISRVQHNYSCKCYGTLCTHLSQSQMHTCMCMRMYDHTCMQYDAQLVCDAVHCCTASLSKGIGAEAVCKSQASDGGGGGDSSIVPTAVPTTTVATAAVAATLPRCLLPHQRRVLVIVSRRRHGATARRLPCRFGCRFGGCERGYTSAGGGRT